CELTHDLIKAGKIKVDPSQNDDLVVTYHDSCNVARASRMGDMPGGQFIIPRELIKSVANNFHNMADDTIYESTFCCGGGGGLLTDDLMEVRVKGALPRVTALNSVVQEYQVNFMATICAICKAQFTKVLPKYGFDMSMVGGVHQLVSKAILLEAVEKPDSAE
ncbi:MAG: (Fe-S)-binding protein, partial [Thiobacillus sp.]|nr:(Fe-S)-binding protein [Thiobacillus sp.]